MVADRDSYLATFRRKWGSEHNQSVPLLDRIVREPPGVRVGVDLVDPDDPGLCDFVIEGRGVAKGRAVEVRDGFRRDVDDVTEVDGEAFFLRMTVSHGRSSLKVQEPIIWRSVKSPSRHIIDWFICESQQNI